jgi:hypothetical protein
MEGRSVHCERGREERGRKSDDEAKFHNLITSGELYKSNEGCEVPNKRGGFGRKKEEGERNDE